MFLLEGYSQIAIFVGLSAIFVMFRIEMAKRFFVQLLPNTDRCHVG